MTRVMTADTLTPPEESAHVELCRRHRQPKPQYVEWHPMDTAPRDGTTVLALVSGREVRVQWRKTPHLPLVAFCLEGTQTPCNPDAWRPDSEREAE